MLVSWPLWGLPPPVQASLGLADAQKPQRVMFPSTGWHLLGAQGTLAECTQKKKPGEQRAELSDASSLSGALRRG